MEKIRIHSARFTAILFLILFMLPACTPGIRIVKNPDDRDEGIRYYRPKPYLLVTPAEIITTNKDGSQTYITHQYMQLEIKTLPDFSEEYSVHVSPGLGIANVSITLTDGWNLTSINQELDTQFDETLDSVANIVKAVAPGGLIKGANTDSPADRKVVVKASNVPVGLYESIIGYDCKSRKRIFGWRYVGFSPFNYCPVNADGEENTCCADGSLDLYGLVFENGVMVFKRIGDIQIENTKPSELQRQDINEQK